jgi:hypothetical protein
MHVYQLNRVWGFCSSGIWRFKATRCPHLPSLKCPHPPLNIRIKMTYLKNHCCKFEKSWYKWVQLQTTFTDEAVLSYFKFMLSLDLKNSKTATDFTERFKCAQTTTAAKGISTCLMYTQFRVRVCVCIHVCVFVCVCVGGGAHTASAGNQGNSSNTGPRTSC